MLVARFVNTLTRRIWTCYMYASIARYGRLCMKSEERAVLLSIRSLDFPQKYPWRNEGSVCVCQGRYTIERSFGKSRTPAGRIARTVER